MKISYKRVPRYTKGFLVSNRSLWRGELASQGNIVLAPRKKFPGKRWYDIHLGLK
jgi:hypothetical protein